MILDRIFEEFVVFLIRFTIVLVFFALSLGIVYSFKKWSF